MMKRPVVLCILDGWGVSTEAKANAPYLAHTLNFDALMRDCPNAELCAHGVDVGLPEGQMGNSEVGHTNIGAGRIVRMDLSYIDEAIATNSFQTKPALLDFIAQLKQSGGSAHLLGIMSDGGVHCHITHIIAAANLIFDAGIPVALHLATDGRDVAPVSALGYLERLTAEKRPGVKIATLSGRLYGYDRDYRWERVARAYRLVVEGDGIPFDGQDSAEALKHQYEQGKKDEFIPPLCADDYRGVKSGDGLFCLNFRPDRARQFLSALLAPEFDCFARGERADFAAALGMVSYSDTHDSYMASVFERQKLTNTLGEWVSKLNKTQFRVAETEKYPHVSFFFNGGYENPFEGESRSMLPSPKVKTYDMVPEMSAQAVTDELVRAIGEGYDFILANFANPDMVGHTGDLAATITACEAVDYGLGRAVKALKVAGGAMIVTADHGNCEQMIDPESGQAHTAHTTNPVPVILVGGSADQRLKNGRLADLAPSLLELMGLELPPEMNGRSLIFRNFLV